MSTKETLKLESLPGYPEPIGRDTEPSSGGNTAGTLLYHLAAIEADWLYVEVLEEDFPEAIVALFPVAVRDAAGRLSPVRDVTLAEHLDRLSFVRGQLLKRFIGIAEEDYRRLRQLPGCDVTPEWVLHHLTQHEALHRGQILALTS